MLPDTESTDIPTVDCDLRIELNEATATVKVERSGKVLKLSYTAKLDSKSGAVLAEVCTICESQVDLGSGRLLLLDFRPATPRWEQAKVRFPERVTATGTNEVKSLSLKLLQQWMDESETVRKFLLVGSDKAK